MSANVMLFCHKKLAKSSLKMNAVLRSERKGQVQTSRVVLNKEFERSIMSGPRSNECTSYCANTFLNVGTPDFDI